MVSTPGVRILIVRSSRTQRKYTRYSPAPSDAPGARFGRARKSTQPHTSEHDQRKNIARITSEAGVGGTPKVSLGC